jgi:hypothetical protein
MTALRSEAAPPMTAANEAPAKAVPEQVAQLDETPAPVPNAAPAKPDASLAMNMPAKLPDATPMTSTRNAPEADQAPAAMKWLPGSDGNTIPATATAEASPSMAQTTPTMVAAAATASKPEAAADAAPATGPTVVAAAPAHPAGKHGSWIQLATFRSEQNAKDQLKATMSGNQDLLHGLPVTLRRVDLGAEKGVYYLLRVGPMESIAQAHDLCSALKDRKIDCIIAK